MGRFQYHVVFGLRFSVSYASVTWILDSTQVNTWKKTLKRINFVFQSWHLSSVLCLQPPFFVLKSWPNFCTTCSTSAKICNVHVKIGNMSNGPFCAIVLKSSGTLLHPPVKPQWASATYMWHRQHVKYWNEGTQQLHGKTHARLRVLTRCFSLVLVLSENWTYP